MIIELITLLALDGRYVHINKAAIVSISGSRSSEGKLMSGKVQCAVTLANGKFVATAESCESVMKRLREE
jgi:uncharacterized protein YlzI (FlbEa/FlbD family)